MPVAAPRDVLGDVAGREQAPARRRLAHEAANPRPALEPALSRKLAQRPVHRHPAETEARHQLVLRRHPAARPEFAGSDPRHDVLLHLEIARSLLLRLIAHVSCPRTHAPAWSVAFS